MIESSKTLDYLQELFLATYLASIWPEERSIFYMRTKEIRRLRLLELHKNYSYREIAETVIAHKKRYGTYTPKGKKDYLDRYLSQLGAETDGRGMGAQLASDIEDAYGKPKGWMDRLGASSAEVNELLDIWKQFPEEEQQRILYELTYRLRALKEKEHTDPDFTPPRTPPRKPLS